MLLKNKRIALGITSEFCAIDKIIPQIKCLKSEGTEIFPIMSFDCYNDKTRSKKYVKLFEEITEKNIINSIEEAEKIGYEIETDIMAIIPATGNTIGKLAHGIIDTPVLAAASTNLKYEKNIVIGIAASNGLSLDAENIGKLLNQKKIFFIPFRQINPITKPNALLFSSIYVKETVTKALQGEQIQPILI